MKKMIEITTEYITLGQFLKFVGIIRSGAMAKEYIMTNKILVNGEIETRRGRKLYKSYVIIVNNEIFELV